MFPHTLPQPFQLAHLHFCLLYDPRETRQSDRLQIHQTFHRYVQAKNLHIVLHFILRLIPPRIQPTHHPFVQQVPLQQIQPLFLRIFPLTTLLWIQPTLLLISQHYFPVQHQRSTLLSFQLNSLPLTPPILPQRTQPSTLRCILRSSPPKTRR